MKEKPIISGGLYGFLSRKSAQLLYHAQPYLSAHPKKILSVMLIAIVISAICCFTILRTPKQSSASMLTDIKSAAPQVQQGSALSSKISLVMELQRELNTLTGLDTLSPADSLRLQALLLRLGQIQNQNKQHEKDKP